MRKMLILLCSIGVLSGCGAKPTDPYKTYMESLQKGNTNEAFNALDKRTKDLLEQEGGFTAVANETNAFIKSHKGIKVIKMKNVTQKDGIVTAKVTIGYNDGFTKEGIETKYIKENGKWKLSFVLLQKGK